MNIVFVLYHDFRANSAIQVHHFANGLAGEGCHCSVVVPENKETCHSHIAGDVKYTPLTFEEFNSADNITPPDIIHAWTPREIVRKQVRKMKEKFSLAKLIIDLEDNEELILESSLDVEYSVLEKMPIEGLDQIIPSNLSHPIHYRQFLEEADGATIIMDTLSEFIPEGKPTLVLWPILDESRFFPREKDEDRLKAYGIEDNEIVLSYVGNVHSSNWKEVRSLYLAVALANREGVPVKLIRAGKDYFPFWGDHADWAHQYSMELGLVPNSEIPEILALADILIQPGKADKFNDYRLPSKLPEFLAMGKPVALPKTNLGRFLKDGKEAIIMKKGDALEILQVIKKVKESPEEVSELANAGKRFADENFNTSKISSDLLQFYQRLLQ